MTWRAVRGLVFVRMPPYKLGLADGSQRPGVVLNLIRTDDAPPPYMAEAWKVTGGKASYDFGGRFLVRGDGKLVWEWIS